ncbi:unnamed protein product [Plutella xylostella]|uniref:(diamondback moth) hypothetical protein n=1 Tax=Plutella xylostella TaxID=51655 RepID=A0A8S4FPK2_PLUXY|nr:unnamed protein product [Plutella xylostella]
MDHTAIKTVQRLRGKAGQSDGILQVELKKEHETRPWVRAGRAAELLVSDVLPSNPNLESASNRIFVRHALTSTNKKLLNSTEDLYSAALGTVLADHRATVLSAIGVPSARVVPKTAKTDKLAPMLVSLPKPQRPKLLLPPGRWTTYPDDDSIKFPFETFVPKLQFLNVVLPKEMPRLVKIERLRRKFLAVNIKKMLRSYGIQPFWLLPPSEYDLTDEEYYSLYSPYPKLDLEIFDNTDFDCRTPEEWMGLGLIDGEQHPCPGLAYIPRDETKTKKIYGGDKIQIFNNIYDWTNAAVFSFDKITDKWHIMALDGTKRRFDIPRIRLMFKADDPETFVQRIKFAVDHRNEVENNIRFYLYLDCLMLHALPEIPSNWMEQIMGLVRMNKKIVPDEVQLNILRQEAENLYAKMQGKMVMLYTMQLYPTSYNFINEPTPDAQTNSNVMPPKRRQYSSEDLNKALKFIKDKEGSIRQASKLFSVPRSTLQFKIDNPHIKPKSGPDPFLTESEERDLYETGFNICPKSGKVLAEKGSKNVYQIEKAPANLPSLRLPAHVAAFRPIKVAWKKALHEWYAGNNHQPDNVDYSKCIAKQSTSDDTIPSLPEAHLRFLSYADFCDTIGAWNVNQGVFDGHLNIELETDDFLSIY